MSPLVAVPSESAKEGGSSQDAGHSRPTPPKIPRKPIDGINSILLGSKEAARKELPPKPSAALPPKPSPRAGIKPLSTMQPSDQWSPPNPLQSSTLPAIPLPAVLPPAKQLSVPGQTAAEFRDSHSPSSSRSPQPPPRSQSRPAPRDEDSHSQRAEGNGNSWQRENRPDRAGPSTGGKTWQQDDGEVRVWDPVNRYGSTGRNGGGRARDHGREFNDGGGGYQDYSSHSSRNQPHTPPQHHRHSPDNRLPRGGETSRRHDDRRDEWRDDRRDDRRVDRRDDRWDDRRGERRDEGGHSMSYREKDTWKPGSRSPRRTGGRDRPEGEYKERYRHDNEERGIDRGRNGSQSTAIRPVRRPSDVGGKPPISSYRPEARRNSPPPRPRSPSPRRDDAEDGELERSPRRDPPISRSQPVASSQSPVQPRRSPRRIVRHTNNRAASGSRTGSVPPPPSGSRPPSPEGRPPTPPLPPGALPPGPPLTPPLPPPTPPPDDSSNPYSFTSLPLPNKSVDTLRQHSQNEMQKANGSAAHPAGGSNYRPNHNTTRPSTPHGPSRSGKYKFTTWSKRKEEEELGRLFEGTTTLKDYDLGTKLGEGTFGVVTKATERMGGAVVALKKLITHNPRDGVSVTTVREIKILKALEHENVVPIRAMVVTRKHENDRGHRGDVFMVFPYMDHDLCGLLANKDFKPSVTTVKTLLKQLLGGLAYIHGQNIIHRDIKTANILVDRMGKVMIADFGLARAWTPKGSMPPHMENEYTNMVVTRWYRAPELLLGKTKYGPEIDLWSTGCVFGEMFTRSPILCGESDRDQLYKIVTKCGPLDEDTFPGWRDLPGFPESEGHPWDQLPLDKNILDQLSSDHHLNKTCLDLLGSMLCLDPAKRITATDALDHMWFWSTPRAEEPRDGMITVESSHEFTTRRPEKAAPAPMVQHRPRANQQHANYVSRAQGQGYNARAGGIAGTLQQQHQQQHQMGQQQMAHQQQMAMQGMGMQAGMVYGQGGQAQGYQQHHQQQQPFPHQQQHIPHQPYTQQPQQQQARLPNPYQSQPPHLLPQHVGHHQNGYAHPPQSGFDVPLATSGYPVGPPPPIPQPPYASGIKPPPPPGIGLRPGGNHALPSRPGMGVAPPSGIKLSSAGGGGVRPAYPDGAGVNGKRAPPTGPSGGDTKRPRIQEPSLPY